MAANQQRCDHQPPTPNVAVGRGGTSSGNASGGCYHTIQVCQATPRPDSEVVGPRRVDEGCVSPTAEGQRRDISPTASFQPQARNHMKLGTGRCLMSPLPSPLACTPAENLQNSRVRPHFAFKLKRKMQDQKSSIWQLSSWNVRSLLDAESPVETAKQGRDVAQAEYRKIDQVVSELNRYKVSVAALQETKWYGNDVYHVRESIVLAAGHPVTPPGEHFQRGEGVALVLNGQAVRAWREAGEQWKAWSQ